MYPNLETKRLVLKPLLESDFDNMFKIVSDQETVKLMFWNLFPDPDVFKKEFIKQVKCGAYFSIRKKKNDEFIGFYILLNHIDKKKCEVKYSQLHTALLPKYRRQGFCTEVTEKILHFAFLGIKTPWICANQYNPIAGEVLQKCGFEYFKNYKEEKGNYNQYRYTRDDYIKNNAIDVSDKNNTYKYSTTIKTSPYSYDKPIRNIDKIKLVKEPTGYLCGQSVIAMLANVSVDDAIDIIGHDRGTSVAEISNALDWYGIKHGNKRIRYTEGTTLPDICILSLKLPGYGHWSLYFKGTIYDPEFGISKDIPTKARLCYYWEIKN